MGGFAFGVADQQRPSGESMTSQGGVLDLPLTAQAGSVSLAGRSAALYSYNGSVPGPRLEIRPGDQVRIRFVNRLPEVTNLHFHGLHVSPSGNADNVFLEIPPGENQTYEFSLPQDHRGGTYGTTRTSTTRLLARFGLASRVC